MPSLQRIGVHGACAVVGLDVDESDRAAVNLPLGAVQSRANFVGAFDIFAVATAS